MMDFTESCKPHPTHFKCNTLACNAKISDAPMDWVQSSFNNDIELKAIYTNINI